MLLVIIREWNLVCNHVYLYAVPSIKDGVQSGFLFDFPNIISFKRELDFSLYDEDEIVVLKTDKNLDELRKWLRESNYTDYDDYNLISHNCAHAVLDTLKQSNIDLAGFNEDSYTLKRVFTFIYFWSSILTPNDVFELAKKSPLAIPHKSAIKIAKAKLNAHIISAPSDIKDQLIGIMRTFQNTKDIDAKCALLSHHIHHNQILKKHPFLECITFFGLRGDTISIKLLKMLESALLKRKLKNGMGEIYEKAD